MSDISKELVDAIRSEFEALPVAPTNSFTPRTAILELRPVLLAALDKGYSYDDLRAKLVERHPEFASVSAKSLRRYLSSGGAKAKAPGRPARTSARGAAATSPSAQPQPPERMSKRSARATGLGQEKSVSASEAVPVGRPHAGLKEDM